jgi:hypothetical protein
MAINETLKRTGRGLAVAAALVGGVMVTAPQPAQARVSPGWAAAIGVGSFALGAAAARGAYGYGYPGYGYYAAPPAYYYPPAPAYYPAARSCWDPYYRRYYGC